MLRMTYYVAILAMYVNDFYASAKHGLKFYPPLLAIHLSVY